MAFDVFNSAGKVGQEGTITWVRSGCAGDKTEKDLKIAKALYADALIEDVGGKDMDNFNLGFGVPKAVTSYFDAHQEFSNQTVLALIEADFMFLSKLSVDDLETNGIPMNGGSLIQHEGAVVGGLVGAAQHYQCCDNLGPPYIFSVESWREISPRWSHMAATSDGWGEDQKALAQSVSEAGVQMNVFDHFMVSDVHVSGEAWSLVDGAVDHALQRSSPPGGDVCATGNFMQLPDGPRLPTFMHMVRPWSVTESGDSQKAWGFSKYQMPPGWKMETSTDGMLECGMPLMAVPPANLLQTASFDARERWAVCTIFHGLNSMLTNYKQEACPNGSNEAKAFKMKVPLEWTNELLHGAEEAAPAGTDLDWMRRCAGPETGPHC